MLRVSCEKLALTPPRVLDGDNRRDEAPRLSRRLSQSRRKRIRPHSHRYRSRPRSRRGRSRSRRSGRSYSRSRKILQSRERSQAGPDYSNRRQSKSLSDTPDSITKTALGTIISRLTAIEASMASSTQISSSILSDTPPLQKNHNPTTQTLVDALGFLAKNKPSNYYVSNFDPAINNFEVWCTEVDRARRANHWDDFKCFSRVAHCLRGDANTWLNEWNTHERSWSNFVKEFKSLCPQKINYVQILLEVLNTTSNNFLSYAEYARQLLLRLRIIKGLSEELMVQIVVYGISDIQVRAAATNANLTTENLVSFLSTYIKPTREN